MEKSAGIIICRKDAGELKFLLLHYKAGHWDFPKGHVEKGETDIQAAIRETKEETGISDVRIVEGFNEKISYFYRCDGKAVFKEVVFFLGETKTGEVKISFEHIGFEWLNYDDAMPRLTFKNSREMLVKAVKFLNTKNL